MIGTFINIGTVLLGGIIGTTLGGRISERIRTLVISGLGLFTIGLGIKMFLETENSLLVVCSLIIGALLGEWWKIEEGLQQFGGWLENKFMKNNGQGAKSTFIKGFLTASLLFIIGPMSILGSIQDGLTGNYELLAIKAVLDGFSALAFSSSLGIGVVFSIIPLFIYQGTLTLLAVQVQSIVTTEMMAEMTAVGGIIILSLGFSSLLEIKKIRSGNFLPALIVAPLIVWLLDILGIALP